ncbi:MAG: S41 family peptidase [Clostridia bacterium]
MINQNESNTKKTSFWKIVWNILATFGIVYLVISIFLGIFYKANFYELIEISNLIKFNSIYQDKFTPENIFTGLYRGIASSTGDYYTYYLTPAEWKEKTASFQGEGYAGIGVTVTEEENGFLLVTRVNKKGVAIEAGIKPGDSITAIEGIDVRTLGLDGAVEKMRGLVDTKVTIKVMNGTTKKIAEKTMVRKELIAESVVYKTLTLPEGVIAYIQINGFNYTTPIEMKAAFAEIEKTSYAGIVLDLRANGGGLLESVLDVAGYFLPEGPLFYEKLNGKEVVYKTDKSGTEKPMMVLIDGGTASAAEVLAGAIQDKKKGLLIGEQSYGKGIVQSNMPLSNGGGLSVTIAEYLTPNRRNIHKIGLTPDIKLEMETLARIKAINFAPDLENDLQLRRAILELNKLIN